MRWADKRITVGGAGTFDGARKLAQLVRSVEAVLGPACPDSHQRAAWHPTPAPPYLPAWGCSRCDTRWVTPWSSPGRPSCWCCERDDLVYGV